MEYQESSVTRAPVASSFCGFYLYTSAVSATSCSLALDESSQMLSRDSTNAGSIEFSKSVSNRIPASIRSSSLAPIRWIQFNLLKRKQSEVGSRLTSIHDLFAAIRVGINAIQRLSADLFEVLANNKSPLSLGCYFKKLKRKGKSKHKWAQVQSRMENYLF